MRCWKEVPVIFKLVVQPFHLKLGLLNRRAHVSGIIACCLFDLKLFLLKIVDVFVINFFWKVHVIVFFSSFIIAQVNALLFKLIIVGFQCSIIIDLVLLLIWEVKLFYCWPFRQGWKCGAATFAPFTAAFAPFIFSLRVRIQLVSIRCLQRFFSRLSFVLCCDQ